jgi:hypothetical protein
MKLARKKCSVNVARWMSYAAAGAATISAVNESEAAYTYLYSGPMSTMVKAGSATIAFPASVEIHPITVNGHPGTNAAGYLGTFINNNRQGNIYHGRGAADYFRGYAYSNGHGGTERVVGFNAGGNNYMSRLGSGVKIATQHFGPNTFGNIDMASLNQGGNFKWGGAAGLTGFLGFEFSINSGPEMYGWVQLENTTGSPKNGLEILGYAYSTDPTFVTGQTMAPVPEPASLALLATGAVGLLAMRAGRKRKPAVIK